MTNNLSQAMETLLSGLPSQLPVDMCDNEEEKVAAKAAKIRYEGLDKWEYSMPDTVVFAQSRHKIRYHGQEIQATTLGYTNSKILPAETECKITSLCQGTDCGELSDNQWRKKASQTKGLRLATLNREASPNVKLSSLTTSLKADDKQQKFLSNNNKGRYRVRTRDDKNLTQHKKSFDTSSKDTSAVGFGEEEGIRVETAIVMTIMKYPRSAVKEIIIRKRSSKSSARTQPTDAPISALDPLIKHSTESVHFKPISSGAIKPWPKLEQGTDLRSVSTKYNELRPNAQGAYGPGIELQKTGGKHKSMRSSFKGYKLYKDVDLPASQFTDEGTKPTNMWVGQAWSARAPNGSNSPFISSKTQEGAIQNLDPRFIASGYDAGALDGFGELGDGTSWDLCDADERLEFI